MVAVNKVGIINTPNQPMYRRLLVDVTQLQNCAQTLALSRCCKVVVMLGMIAMYFSRFVGSDFSTVITVLHGQ
jgi:hypothetical protein